MKLKRIEWDEYTPQQYIINLQSEIEHEQEENIPVDEGHLVDRLFDIWLLESC